MAFFVTGINGFVGKNLIEYFGISNVKHLNLRDNWMKQIEDQNSLSIVHLAGKAHDVLKTSDPDVYYKVNFELTKQLYDAFLKSNSKKFIFISSVKAVADTVSGTLSEDDLPNPLTHYGKSKLLAEQYILSQPLSEGKACYILRPCMIHGPGNKGNLNLLYTLLQKGIPYPLAAFHNKRSFLSIENLCFVIKALLQNEVLSGVYNVADDDALSTSEVIMILAKSLRKTPRLWSIPSGMVQNLAKISDFLGLPFNSETLKKLTENYIVSNRKIKEAIDSDLPVETREGLLVTAQSFKHKR